MTPSRDAAELQIEAAIRRARHVVGPPILAAVMVAVAVAVHWFGVQMYFNVIGGFLLLLGLEACTDLPLAKDHRWWRRYQERLFGSGAWISGAAWMVYTWYAGVSLTLLAILGAVLVPFWALWFRHRRIRRSVDVDRTIAAWGNGENAGLKGVKIVGVKANGNTITGRLRGRRGEHTWSTFQSSKARIAGMFGMKASQLHLKPGDEECEAQFILIEGSTGGLRWVMPPADESIAGRKFVGRAIGTAQDMFMSFWRPNHGAVDGLGVGAKGGGKSNYAEVTAAYAVRAPDCLPWIVDFKPGAQQWKAWADMVDWFATSAEEFDRMIMALKLIIEDRGRQSGRIFKPSRQKPLILLLLDEASLAFLEELVADGDDYDAKAAARKTIETRIAMLESVLAVNRSLGVAIRFYTQRGLAEAIGGSTIRAHLAAGELAMFRVQKTADARLVFDLDGEHADVDPAKISRSSPGQGFILTAENEDPILTQTVFISEEDVENLRREVLAAAPKMLEPSAAKAAGELYANRQRTAPTPSGTVVDVVEPFIPPTRKRLTPEESLDVVWRAVRSFGKKGAGPKEIAERCQKSEQIIKARLKELLEMSPPRVDNPRRGKWVALDTGAPLVEAVPEPEHEEAVSAELVSLTKSSSEVSFPEPGEVSFPAPSFPAPRPAADGEPMFPPIDAE
jgi:hypothetical protein